MTNITLRFPVLLNVTPFIEMGFYDYHRARQCVFKGCKKNLLVSSPLPPEEQTIQVIVGLFYHEVMALSHRAQEISELKQEIEVLISKYQARLKADANLSAKGPFSGWQAVNVAANRSIEFFKNKKNSENVGSIEKSLRSKCGRFIGRPDFFSYSEQKATLTELKSTDIRKENGEVKDEYKEQALFYSFLLIQNFGVGIVYATIESASRDIVAISITKEEAEAYYLNCCKNFDEFNAKIVGFEKGTFAGLQSPSLENCLYCPNRVLCDSFKRSQRNINSEHGWILQGKISGKDSKSLTSDTLFLIDENLDESVKVKCSKVSSRDLAVEKKYIFTDLSRERDQFIFTRKTKVMVVNE